MGNQARTSIENGLTDIGLHLAVHHHDDYASVVFSSSTGPTAHLNVFPGGDPSEVLAVKFGALGEDDRLGGHINTCEEEEKARLV